MQMLEVGLGFLVSAESFIMEMGEVCQTQQRINKVLLSQYGIQYVGMKPERKKRQSREKEKKNREEERVCLRSTRTKIGR